MMERMYQAYNSQSTQLLADISAASKTIPVADASVFPEGPNYATIGADDRAEVVLYASVDAQRGQLTGVERGKSFTVARGWPMGSEVYHCASADNMNAIMQNVGMLDAEKAALAGATFTGQTYYQGTDTPFWHGGNLPVETGEWTPELTPGEYTYSKQSGMYSRIGKTLFLTGGIDTISVKTAGTGRIVIMGLPYHVGDTQRGGVTVTYQAGYTLGGLTFHIGSKYLHGGLLSGGIASATGIQSRFQVYFQGICMLP